MIRNTVEFLSFGIRHRKLSGWAMLLLAVILTVLATADLGAI